MKTHLNFSARDMADIMYPSRLYKASILSLSSPNMPNIVARSIPGAELILFPGVSSRTAAKAGAIQQRDAGFPRQGSFLEEIDTPRRVACPHWIDIGFFMDQWDGSSSGVSRDIQVVFPLPVLPVTRILR